MVLNQVMDMKPQRPKLSESRQPERGPEAVPIENYRSRSTVVDQPLIPVRMVNEYVYCPRLAYLEWVQKEWRDSSDTIEGKHVHRKVDKKSGTPPDPDDEREKPSISRSVEISSENLGITAKIDVLEIEDGKAVPVDFKRGKRPHIARNAYDPERVQLCAQGLLLESIGYETDHGVLYFAGSRERVTVPFDIELRNLTRESIHEFKKIADMGEIPPPLEDSPKCPRCSLVSICMPDETNLFREKIDTVRPLAVKQERRYPLYIQSNNASVTKQGYRLIVQNADDEPVEVRLNDISQLATMGNVRISTPAMHELMRREIPISWHSYGGWFLGHTVGTGNANVELRTAQYKASFDDEVCRQLARDFVGAKIKNCRTLLKRNWREAEEPGPVLNMLSYLARRSLSAEDLSSLLGLEGAAATQYFQNFNKMLKKGLTDDLEFSFKSRNRRPPTDPINAMLSYGYAILTRSLTNALTAVGFDPYRGFFHQPRYGRPALALDMMEAFRPLIVDSAVLMAINNGEIKPKDFERSPLGVNLKEKARKKFISILERRLSDEITHPIFGYKIEYRRLFELQARLLGRFLLGEIPYYPNFITR